MSANGTNGQTELSVKVDTQRHCLVITIPMEAKFEQSTSGKSIVIATTHGNVRLPERVEGLPLTVGVNAYISNPNYKKAE